MAAIADVPTFTTDEWAAREARCDQIAELAVEILQEHLGDVAGWTISHWPRDIAPGVRDCREWLTVTGDTARVRALHDACSQRRLLSSTSNIGHRMFFTPR